MAKTPEQLKNSDWFEPTIENLQATNTELTYIERFTRIQKYWEIGQEVKRLTPMFEQAGVFGRDILKVVGKHIGLSSRLMYDIQRMIDKFESLEAIESLPEGKNLTWTKLIKNHLQEGTNPNKANRKKKNDWHKCPKCGSEFTEIDEKEHVHE